MKKGRKHGLSIKGVSEHEGKRGKKRGKRHGKKHGKK